VLFLRFWGCNTIFQSKCKICRSGKADNIEFCRFYLEWSYKTIIENFQDDVDELSGYNLSTHFNRHTSLETKRFWREIKAEATSDELAELSEQAYLPMD
jgi:hypothetical protein